MYLAKIDKKIIIQIKPTLKREKTEIVILSEGLLLGKLVSRRDPFGTEPLDFIEHTDAEINLC